MLSKLISATESLLTERISSAEQTNTRRRERELARVFAERDFRWVPKILCEVVHVITLRATKINKGPIWWRNEREGKKTSRGKELARRKSYQQSCAADDKNSISICFLLSSQDGPDTFIAKWQRSLPCRLANFECSIKSRELWADALAGMENYSQNWVVWGNLSK